MLRRTNATVIRPNAADEKKEEVYGVNEIAKVLATLQEIQADVMDIKEILREAFEEDSEYSSGEEVVG